MSDREHQGGERFLIELEALSDDHPPIRRLRHFLKSALRTWRLKCRSINEVTPYPDPPAELQAGQLPNDLAEDDAPDRQTTEAP